MRGEPFALPGCAPTPLASYLKALGVLRLIASPANHVSGAAADPHARGWWENERFHLRTTLDRDALMRFLLHDYAPSPIIAPWNGRAGFLEGGAVEDSTRVGAVLMRDIEQSKCRRLKLMRDTVHTLRNSAQVTEYNRLREREKQLEKELKDNSLQEEDKQRKQVERSRVRKHAGAAKSLLLPTLRSGTDSHHLGYLDACYVLSTDDIAAPLLGSGGNDGSRDFGVNFAEKVQALIEFNDGRPTSRASAEIESALFSVPRRVGAQGSMGQFSPGHGGPNATTGYQGANPLNAWDVVLAMEGTMTFAGALTRRWGATTGSRAAFPFTFEPTGAGTGGLSPEDPNRPRGEVWTPLWSKPATFSETAAILEEGRLTLGQRAARTGLDAARSVAQIGAARGIAGFERYSLIQPDGKMPYQATPLGRFNTPDQPRRDLVADLEAGDWLSRARRLVGDKKKVPARARKLMRRLEDALFEMTVANREAAGTRHALVALGGFVGWFASNPRVRKKVEPPPPLSSAWLHRADDESPEFRIAAALAALGLPGPSGAVQPSDPQSHSDAEHASPPGPNSDSTAEHETQPAQNGACAIGHGGTKTAPPMAAHFAPLNERKFFYREQLSKHRAWSDTDTPRTMVWGAGPLVPNLIAVLERRLVESSIRGLEDKPLAGGAAASLADVTAFLSGDFNDDRCAQLLAGLVWARPARLRRASQPTSRAFVPFAYAALKPAFTPDAALRLVGALPPTAQMPIPPGLTAPLRAAGSRRDGRATDAAVELAFRRARASGLPTPFETGRAGARHSSIEHGRMGAGVPADRLAAGLLIPIHNQALTTLIKRAYPGALPEGENMTTEDTTHED